MRGRRKEERMNEQHRRQRQGARGEVKGLQKAAGGRSQEPKSIRWKQKERRRGSMDESVGREGGTREARQKTEKSKLWHVWGDI